MLEFLYTIFLLRLSGKLLYKTIQTPQSFGNILKTVGYIALTFYGFIVFSLFTEKSFSEKNILTVLTIAPFLFVFVGIVIWGGTILKKVSQEKYNTLHTL